MTAFVLGNGRSRQDIDFDLLMRLGPVYGCNALYRTNVPTVLVATDAPIARAIQESGYSQKNRFYTRKPLPNSGAQIVPRPYYGYSSGPAAAGIAALDGHNTIYLIGFDLGPLSGDRFNNIYADTEFYKPSIASPTFTGNWVRQLGSIIREFRDRRFVRVHGDCTAEIEDFAKLLNLEKMDIDQFLQRINTSKDL